MISSKQAQHDRVAQFLTCYTEGTCECRRLVQFIFVGAVYHNALTTCAHCYACEELPVCVAVRLSLTLRISCEKIRKKNPLPYNYLIQAMSVICARLGSKGKVESSKRKENRRLSFLFAPAAGAATFPPSADGESPAEVQRKTPRPERANTLTQFVCPGQPVQRKEPPVRANPPAAVRVPRSAGAEKGAARQGEHACGSSSIPLSRCRKRSRPVRANTLTQFVCPGQPVQRKRVPHTDTCPPVKTKYFYALHYKSDVL